jgi:hypothetical protein
MRAVICALTIVAWLVTPVHSQRVVDVNVRSRCDDCRIQLTPITVVTDPDGRGGLAVPNSVAIDDKGRILVASSVAAYEFSVYGRNGAFVKKIGIEGEGPGEFRRIGFLLAHGGTVHVFDTALLRWTTFDGEFNFVKTAIMPQYPIRAVVWRDTLVINAKIATRDRVGFPVHVVSSEGSLIRSYGYDSLTYRADIPYADSRLLAACPGGSLWWHRNAHI